MSAICLCCRTAGTLASRTSRGSRGAYKPPARVVHGAGPVVAGHGAGRQGDEARVRGERADVGGDLGWDALGEIPGGDEAAGAGAGRCAMLGGAAPDGGAFQLAVVVRARGAGAIGRHGGEEDGERLFWRLRRAGGRCLAGVAERRVRALLHVHDALFPLSEGGDHSVTYPIRKALGNRSVGLVCLNSPFDTCR